MRINEVNSSSLKGSLGKNLTANKVWAFSKLKEIKNNFDTIYILGSWFGNAAILLGFIKDIKYKKIINVEIDSTMLKTSKNLIKLAGSTDVDHMLKDANLLDYRQLGDDGLVINFSCNNMSGNNWFDNIPGGTMVLLSSRNNDPNADQEFNSLEEFESSYPLSTTLFSGQKKFKDPETKYDLYLLIGIK